MRLMDIHIRNFMRFRKASLKLFDAGMTLIEGRNLDDESASSNGAGKSSIVDALVWCLYGATTHDSCEGDDVVNERRGVNCEVRVRFADDENQVHWIVTRRRAWMKGGKKVQLNLVFVTRNEERKLTKGTIRDTQVEIVRALGMSAATFRHACIFGHGRAYRFSRLTDGDKKSVLDEMLGSEVYAKASQEAGDRLLVVERQRSKLKTELETRLESLQDARKTLRRLEARVRDAERAAKKERTAAKREVKNIKRKLVDVKTASSADARAAWHAARDTAKIAADAHNDSKQAVARLVARDQELTAERRRMSRLESECVTCKQAIDANHVARQLKAIDSQELQLGADLDQAKSDLKWKALEADKTRGEADKLFQRYEDAKRCEAERDVLESKLDAARMRMKCTRTQRDVAATLRDEKRRVKRLKHRCSAVRKQLRRKRRRADHLRFWQHGFGAKGLRSLLLDSALPYLNARLQVYTNALTAGNIAVEFRTQRALKGGGTREDFHVHVSNKHGSSMYDMNSVGERAKIDIVVGLALQDMAASRSRVPINVAFFDEVFDGLDERGVDRAVQVLSQLKRDSAFVITHSDGLKAFFNKRICVVKENGESRLEAA